jgi:hypothetical protein
VEKSEQSSYYNSDIYQKVVDRFSAFYNMYIRMY